MDASLARPVREQAGAAHVRPPGPLAFRRLSLERRGLLLLSELDLVVPPGQTLAVMGRSGTGKTTLLRTISGLAAATRGAVERPGGRVPVVFQEPRLLPWRTTKQNVELVLTKDQRQRASEWLTRVGLANAMHTYPLALSGGMRQRVSIARAFACQEPLLLVDEPFSHLDIVTARQLRAELKRQIAATGCTTVWVTHDPAEAAEVAVRTLIMAGPPHGAWKLIDHPHEREHLAEHLAQELARIELPEPAGASYLKEVG